jgi:hypothetical protein
MELFRHLKCQIMLTAPVIRTDSSCLRCGEGTVGEAEQREILNFSCCARAVADLFGASCSCFGDSVHEFLLRCDTFFFASVNHFCSII